MLKLTTIGLVSLAILIRWLVAQWPHSGQSTPPLFGDYEAQRHWMEVTTNLEAKDWYSNTTDNDLSYWGLDYPPLTAYHMKFFGLISENFLNSSWTKLHESRGFESNEHKLFMRATVLISELLIYIPAIVYYFYKTNPIQDSQLKQQATSNYLRKPNSVAVYITIALFYPAQILVDHGHFQYNSTFLGLVVWAVIFMEQGRQKLSAFFFTLALNYKQMSLYYSLPFFWFIASQNLRLRPIWRGFVNIFLVGLLVLSTFAIIYLPWITNYHALLQISRRLFPFYRGVFEDKVANFWFSLTLFYKYKHLYTLDQILKASTLTTIAASLPAGLHLLFRPSVRNFKYSLVNTALVFFLFSFQVHEKTILLPALPILLTVREHPIATNWFVLISTFSLQPLLIRDGQVIPYFVLMLIYTLMMLDIYRTHFLVISSKLFSLQNFCSSTRLASIVGCFVFSLLALIVKPPQNLPHIHSTINALYSCVHFFGFLLFYYHQQLRGEAGFGGNGPQIDKINLLKKKTN